MIEFTRYPHIKDLILHYSFTLSNDLVKNLLECGLKSSQDAEIFSKFIWEMVGQMNEDEENGVEVLGSVDNSDMIPDISYEITKLMKISGYYSIWEKVSNEEI